ncbi:class I SAM-dependent methyltransferase [Patescibacteria group bacterium]|nr:class I SAM-dependent methyltransferase [Patescibacteria group bacterium]
MNNNKYPGGNELLDPQHLLQDVLELSYGSKAADLGCGSMAFFTLEAAKLVGNKGQIFACDILKDVLSSVESKARQEGLYNIKTVWTNLEIAGASKIPAESVDYAFLVNTLFQTQKHLEMLQEAYRLLKPAGKLLLIEWSPAGGPVGPVKSLRLAQSDVERMAAEVGFTKEKSFAAGQYHYGIIFVK